MGRALLLTSLLLTILHSPEAHATEAQEQQARALYQEGEAAFKQERFQVAHDLFKKSYLLFPSPALLFNMASALQGAGRPHDAAEALRAFLRARPDVPDKGDLESRIRALEEAQRMLDAERALHGPVPGLVLVPTTAEAKQQRRPRRRTTIIVLSTLGATLAIGALGVGLGVGLREHYTASTLHTHAATP